MHHTGDITLAIRSLEGLALGDAYGELYIGLPAGKTDLPDIGRHEWFWTDDTHMAISIVEILKKYDQINQDALAGVFAHRYAEDPFRGYGGGAVTLLTKIYHGADWRDAAPALFGGGSYGNGAAMRVAPLGAYFHEDIRKAAEQARLSAAVTHAHPEGQAGAIAVAVAAAVAAQRPFPQENDFIREVERFVPESETLRRIRHSRSIAADDLATAKEQLGTGFEVSAQDTVPFCIWSAAHHLHSYKDALVHTVAARGDCDTTCAMVGGIVALSVETLPLDWYIQREPLPVL